MLVPRVAAVDRVGRVRLSRVAFTWRQPALAVVVALAAVSPLIRGVTWIGRGATEPLDRGSADPLPAFVRAQSALPEQIRTLVLEPGRSGRLAYTVLRSRDARWGDVETAPPARDLTSLDEVVSDLWRQEPAAPLSTSWPTGPSSTCWPSRPSTPTSRSPWTRPQDCCGSPTPVTPRSGGWSSPPGGSGCWASMANVRCSLPRTLTTRPLLTSMFRLAKGIACSSSPNSQMMGGSPPRALMGRAESCPTRAVSDWAQRFVVGPGASAGGGRRRRPLAALDGTGPARGCGSLLSWSRFPAADAPTRRRCEHRWRQWTSGAPASLDRPVVQLLVVVVLVVASAAAATVVGADRSAPAAVTPEVVPVTETTVACPGLRSREGFTESAVAAATPPEVPGIDPEASGSGVVRTLVPQESKEETLISLQ